MNADAGLTRVVYEVRELALGERTSFCAGRLTVGEVSVRDLLRDPALAEVRLGRAAPGDSVRIVGALDAIQPCSKGPGGGGVFPGLLGPALPAGRGETHVLRGAAVLAAGYLPRAQEAVIDMSGPAAPLSPLSATHNLVVEWTPAEDADWGDVDAALRRGLVRVAAHLAEAALDAEPYAVEELPEPGSTASDRPRVGVVLNLQTQGKFKDVFVYGRSLSGGLPTVISPAELDDGAVVSGQYGHPALKNPTYLHQTHPVVAALR
ncbi:MAG: glycine/sarcosine/betaine reductase component B subunit, partial [Actinomycetota bacterium]|nr:glycine/sarcosine/betaine reductase component B subunit [Actinomycetota bacterium]